MGSADAVSSVLCTCQFITKCENKTFCMFQFVRAPAIYLAVVQNKMHDDLINDFYKINNHICLLRCRFVAMPVPSFFKDTYVSIFPCLIREGSRNCSTF